MCIRDRVIKLVQGMELNNESINTWKNGVERALKKYLPNGTEVKGQVCPNCGLETLIYQEGLSLIHISFRSSVEEIEVKLRS